MSAVYINHNTNKIEYSKFLPLLTCLHFSDAPSRIQFDSEQFPFVTIQSVFSTLTAYCGQFRCSAALPPFSCCPSRQKPVPGWESLSQREALKNQHCFKANRRKTFLQKLSQDMGLLLQSAVLHRSPGSNGTQLVAICSMFISLLTISDLFIFLFCRFVFFSIQAVSMRIC